MRMHVHINHCWCSDSNWGGNYNCRYLVVIKERLTYDLDGPVEPDWYLLEEHEFLDKERLDLLKKNKFFKDKPEVDLRDMCISETRRLRPEVFKWLEDNVENLKGHGREGEKAFAVGTDAYNHRSMDFTIFFNRRSDALNFIKKWSSHKKPTTYFDYFQGIRKELDFKTKKLKVVDNFTLA